MRHNIADGATNEIDRDKTLSSAPANFVYSVDAAHLIRVVNAAVGEGISDILTVHDCFYCLAPQATRFREIIHKELADLYKHSNPLAELRNRNVGSPATQTYSPFRPSASLSDDWTTVGARGSSPVCIM